MKSTGIKRIQFVFHIIKNMECIMEKPLRGVFNKVLLYLISTKCYQTTLANFRRTVPLFNNKNCNQQTIPRCLQA